MVSGFFSNEIIGELRAPAQISQWDISRPNPSGLKHFESGVFKPSAKGLPGERLVADGLRGGFTAQKESGRAIDFGSITPNTSGFWTDTVALTFNLGEINANPKSFFNNMFVDGSVEQSLKAFNLRFWINKFNAFERNPSGTPTFHFLTSADWQRNLTLRSNSSGCVKIAPSSLPSNPNLLVGPDGDFASSGSFKEAEFSHFLYLAGEFPSGVNYLLGTYGGLGSGGFTWRFSYDWTSLDADIRLTDMADCGSGIVLPTGCP